MTVERTTFYAVLAPCWRALSRPTTGLGARRLLRWQVVSETREPYENGQGYVRYIWGYEHVSAHWTRRAADRAADRATQVTR